MNLTWLLFLPLALAATTPTATQTPMPTATSTKTNTSNGDSAWALLGQALYVHLFHVPVPPKNDTNLTKQPIPKSRLHNAHPLSHRQPRQPLPSTPFPHPPGPLRRTAQRPPRPHDPVQTPATGVAGAGRVDAHVVPGPANGCKAVYGAGEVGGGRGGVDEAYQ